jgi:hypothetical protein
MAIAAQPIPLPSLAGLIPRDGILAPDELEQLARDIVARPELWEPLVRVDAEQRRYELIHEDESLDAWVLSWMPGQGTGFHDHYISRSACAARTAGSARTSWSTAGTTASSTSGRATPAGAARATSTACGTRSVSRR